MFGMLERVGMFGCLGWLEWMEWFGCLGWLELLAGMVKVIGMV